MFWGNESECHSLFRNKRGKTFFFKHPCNKLMFKHMPKLLWLAVPCSIKYAQTKNKKISWASTYSHIIIVVYPATQARKHSVSPRRTILSVSNLAWKVTFTSRFHVSPPSGRIDEHAVCQRKSSFIYSGVLTEHAVAISSPAAVGALSQRSFISWSP